MNDINAIDELRGDADLLTKSDLLLSELKKSVAHKINLLLDDLRLINSALKHKNRMQQTNRVAVRHYEMANGRMVDEVIRIMPLPDAISIIRRESQNRQLPQLHTWMLDGYDVEAAAQLR
jgi:hypothetical protein